MLSCFMLLLLRFVFLCFSASSVNFPLLFSPTGLSSCCHNLMHLRLSECYLITDDREPIIDFQSMCKSLDKLKKLELQHIKGIGVLLDHLHLCTQLVELHIESYSKTEMTNQNVEKMNQLLTQSPELYIFMYCEYRWNSSYLVDSSRIDNIPGHMQAWKLEFN